jgi:predicted ATP-binding protein involved in virulence
VACREIKIYRYVGVPSTKSIAAFAASAPLWGTLLLTLRRPLSRDNGRKILMRIREISVENLFGIFNHVIPLNMDEHITIIHGPNGFGKTIILRMIKAVFRGLYRDLASIPFGRMRIVFDEGAVLDIGRLEIAPSNEAGPAIGLDFDFSESGSTRGLFKVTIPQPGWDFQSAMIDALIPELTQLGPRLWYDEKTGKSLTPIDVIRTYGRRLLIPKDTKLQIDGDAEWMESIRESISVHLIETQRLTTEMTQDQENSWDPPSNKPAVERYSSELAGAIKAKLAESAEVSQSLDRSFPTRLLSKGAGSDLTYEQIQQKLDELEKKRSYLRDVGLLDKDDDNQFQIFQQIDEGTQNVLAVYVDVIAEKLSFFDELSGKLAFFMRIVNKRFLFKRMGIDREKGLVFTTSKGALVSPKDLSSGEQHELVLLYELLFRVKPDSLILMDEPELSLHVAWQVNFLNDLKELTSIVPLDVLIATHSPQIINDRWDLTVQLEGPDK